MNTPFTEADRIFVEREYARALAGTTPYEFLRSLHRSCKSNCRDLVIGSADGAGVAAKAAIAALQAGRPFSMVRIGDGEGNILGLTEHFDASELKWFNVVFDRQDHQELGLEAAGEFARDLRGAVCGADVLGFTGFNTDPEELADAQRAAQIIQTIVVTDPGVALGVLRALEFAKQAMESGELCDAVMTNAWIHIGMIGHLETLLASAPRVIVISGRSELEPAFAHRLGDRLAGFMALPLEASSHESGPRPPHYPVRFNQVLDGLRSDLRGTLVLVGAGIFGKIYCDTAKRQGGVALDLGSAFDLLAGETTRPVHSNPAVMGQGVVPWVL